MLPDCVCVPPFDFPELVGVVDPPLAPPVADAVVDVGVDAVLLTEPAVITTGRKETSVPDRVVAVVAGIDSWVRRGPVAAAVHTATEVPERSQLILTVLY